MFDKENFKLLIEKAMGNRKISQYAEDSGVNRTYLSKYINQRLDSPPTPDILKRLSNSAYNNVSYEDFMEAAGYIDNKIDVNEEYIKIPTILKELRYTKGAKQEDVAKAIGISKSGYGYYEQGRSMPDPEMLLKLAKYFNVSVDYLLGNADVKEPIDIPQKYTDKYKITKKDIEQHDEIIKHAQAFMMDDEVGEDDKEKLVAVINKLYWDSKVKNKEKFGKKKNK